jgi:hypothetical protein
MLCVPCFSMAIGFDTLAEENSAADFSLAKSLCLLTIEPVAAGEEPV